MIFLSNTFYQIAYEIKVVNNILLRIAGIYINLSYIASYKLIRRALKCVEYLLFGQAIGFFSLRARELRRVKCINIKWNPQGSVGELINTLIMLESRNLIITQKQSLRFINTPNTKISYILIQINTLKLLNALYVIMYLSRDEWDRHPVHIIRLGRYNWVYIRMSINP